MLGIGRGKVSLYNLILRRHFRGETIGACENMRYCWSIVSNGSWGNMLGGVCGVEDKVQYLYISLLILMLSYISVQYMSLQQEFLDMK